MQSGVRPTPPASAPADFVELMKACWVADTRARPDFASVSRQLAAILHRVGGSTPLGVDVAEGKEERLRSTTFAFLPASTSGVVSVGIANSTIECAMRKKLGALRVARY